VDAEEALTTRLRSKSYGGQAACPSYGGKHTKEFLFREEDNKERMTTDFTDKE